MMPSDDGVARRDAARRAERLLALMARLGVRPRLVLRIAVVAAILELMLAARAPGLGAGAATLLDPSGVSVAAYGGWSAWSRSDALTGRYALVTRSPQGVISLPAVAESAAPFDVELGPNGGSRIAAVYSRCARPMSLTGCHIVVLELGVASASERSLTPQGGGSDHEPTIWNGVVAFLRRNASGGQRRPDSLIVWRIGSSEARSLALPRSRGDRGAGWPAALTGRITGLAFNGRQVAYVTSNVVGSFGETTLWFQPLAGNPVLIDQETGGAGDVCSPEFISPVLSGSWLYAYLHACDPTANPGLDRLTRYRRGEVQRAAYTFLHSGDEAVSSAVLDGTGVDWDAEGIKRLAGVSWRRIAAPVPRTFCSRFDPFC